MGYLEAREEGRTEGERREGGLVCPRMRSKSFWHPSLRAEFLQRTA